VRAELPSAVVAYDVKGAEVRVRLLPLMDAPPDDLEVGVEVTWSQGETVTVRREPVARPFVEWRRRGLTPVFLETPGRWKVLVKFDALGSDGELRVLGSTVGETSVVLLESARAFEAEQARQRVDRVRGLEGTPPGAVPTLLRLRQRCASALAGRAGQEAPDAEAEIALYLADARALAGATRAGSPWIPRPADLPRDGVRATAGGARYRLLVPPRAEGWVPGMTRVPIVLALHGVGGSEDSFFEAHGAGEIVRQCGVRRWLLASPDDPEKALEVLDDVRTLLPVDERRIYVVAHGRGVGALWKAHVERPELFTAVAAISAGTAAPAREDFVRTAGLPLLWVQGGQDPERAGSTAVAKVLLGNGALLEWLDLPDLDPLLVVGASLPRVFRWFDPRARK
jgi:hypothetical protein